MEMSNKIRTSGINATIRISPEVRDALNDLKRGGETQDAVIRRLIGSWEISQNTKEAMKEVLNIEEAA
ncbi:hypothetical protein ES703_43618 [subsurface metagenome]